MGGPTPPVVTVLSAWILVTGFIGLPAAASHLASPGPLDGLHQEAQDPLAPHEHQLALAEHALAVKNDDDRTPDEKAFEIARAALDHRAHLLETGPAPVLDGLEQQRENLDLAQALAEPPTEATLDDAVDVLETAQAWQAAAFEWPAPAKAQPTTTPGLEPSALLEELAHRHGHELSSSEMDALEALDEVPEPAVTRLAATLSAFLDLDHAAEDMLEAASFAYATERTPQDALTWLETIDHDPRAAHADASRPAQGLPSPAQHAATIGFDASRVLDARATFLATLAPLDAALDAMPEEALDAHEPLRIPGVASIDLTGEASTYTEDYAFQLDAGGDDAYHNNAGGTNLGAGCSLEDAAGAAALVDLGGSDAFGDASSPRSCGATGGAYGGVGMLVSAEGDDVFHGGNAGTNGGAIDGLGLVVSLGGQANYEAGSLGTNGGGLEGAGLILDLAGDTRYEGGSLGSNGAGAESGIGAILDTAGDDVYEAGIIGANGAGDGHWLGSGVGAIVDPAGERDVFHADGGGNGAGSREGVGFLYNGPGDAVYVADAFGANGGANNRGVSMLVDAGGDNEFHAAYTGVNGGAASHGVGFLVNLGTASAYTAVDAWFDPPAGGPAGVNGGAARGGVGFLFNADGGASFEAGGWGANGGAYDAESTGLVVTGTGDDAFLAEGGQGANGGASNGATGLIVDEGGDETYQAGSSGTNGGASGSDAIGGIVDLAGHDAYLAEDRATNGGARGGGHGVVVDAGGDDAYKAGKGGVNGGASALSYAVLLDAGGHDSYEDEDGGTGWDKTVAPKGAIGAQLDMDRS